MPYHEGLRAFHPGAFATAVRAGCPVVPMMLCRRPARGLWAWRKSPCLRCASARRCTRMHRCRKNRPRGICSCGPKQLSCFGTRRNASFGRRGTCVGRGMKVKRPDGGFGHAGCPGAVDIRKRFYLQRWKIKRPAALAVFRQSSRTLFAFVLQWGLREPCTSRIQSGRIRRRFAEHDCTAFHFRVAQQEGAAFDLQRAV